MRADESIASFELRWRNTIAELKETELSPKDVIELDARYKIDEMDLKTGMNLIELEYYLPRVYEIRQLFHDFLQKGEIIYRQKQHERKIAFYKVIAEIIGALVALIVTVGGIVYFLN